MLQAFSVWLHTVQGTETSVTKLDSCYTGKTAHMDVWPSDSSFCPD